MNNFKGRRESDRTIMIGKNSPEIMAGMETWRLQKLQPKMMHDPEYRKRKQFAMIFSYGCEVT